MWLDVFSIIRKFLAIISLGSTFTIFYVIIPRMCQSYVCQTFQHILMFLLSLKIFVFCCFIFSLCFSLHCQDIVCQSVYQFINPLFQSIYFYVKVIYQILRFIIIWGSIFLFPATLLLLLFLYPIIINYSFLMKFSACNTFSGTHR